MNNLLLPSEYKIIKFLALNGPSNRYEISKDKETNIKYQTVYSAIKRLHEKGCFIDIFHVDKARTDFDKPSYFATFIGKLAVMAMSENEDAVLDLIATSEPRQFLILEEWEYICQSTEARNYVLSIIRTRFLDLVRSYDFKTWEIQDKPSALGSFRYFLLRSILWDGYPRGGVPRLIDRVEILEFFMGNPQIRERMKQVLIVLEDEARMVNEDIWYVRREYGLEMT